MDKIKIKKELEKEYRTHIDQVSGHWDDHNEAWLESMNNIIDDIKSTKSELCKLCGTERKCHDSEGHCGNVHKPNDKFTIDTKSEPNVELLDIISDYNLIVGYVSTCEKQPRLQKMVNELYKKMNKVSNTLYTKDTKSEPNKFDGIFDVIEDALTHFYMKNGLTKMKDIPFNTFEASLYIEDYIKKNFEKKKQFTKEFFNSINDRQDEPSNFRSKLLKELKKRLSESKERKHGFVEGEGEWINAQESELESIIELVEDFEKYVPQEKHEENCGCFDCSEDINVKNIKRNETEDKDGK